MKIRTGTGYDVHQLAAGYPLIIGGVELQHHLGAVGHSDADVLIHAICDALLGAAGLRDIGYHFPDNDPAYRGIDSRILLKKVVALLKEQDYTIANVDAVVMLEKPKIAIHIPQMVKNLAQTMEIWEGDVSVKATTTEKLGFIGREEGIAAQAVVLLIKETA